MNYKEEVLKIYPFARVSYIIIWPIDLDNVQVGFYIVNPNGYLILPETKSSVQQAWENAYNFIHQTILLKLSL